MPERSLPLKGVGRMVNVTTHTEDRESCRELTPQTLVEKAFQANLLWSTLWLPLSSDLQS